MAERVRDLQPERDETRERAAVHRSREKRKQHGHGALAHHLLPREGADTCWTHEELQPNELNSVYLKFTTFIFLFSMLYIFQNVFNSFYYYLINILLFIKIKLI